jgi:translation initiation factor 1 (eIF-1/SUI1)
MHVMDGAMITHCYTKGSMFDGDALWCEIQEPPYTLLLPAREVMKFFNRSVKFKVEKKRTRSYITIIEIDGVSVETK